LTRLNAIGFAVWLLLLCLPANAATGLDEAAPGLDEAAPGLDVSDIQQKKWDELVYPFLKKHCLECHGAKEPKGEFRVDAQLQKDFLMPAVRAHWSEVANVLNSHEMPPVEKPQPDVADVAKVVDWITQNVVQAELSLRENSVVMRRLNRAEYQNTIRDLVGVEFDISGFPEDPTASGFDNIGSTLSLTPTQLELYLEAARQIIDSAFVDGPRPPKVLWRFEAESGDSDANRVKIGGQNPIVNGGVSPVEKGFKRIHHNSWDRTFNVRDFAMKHAGAYLLRIKAGSHIPSRQIVVDFARKQLEARYEKDLKQNPGGRKWIEQSRDMDLEHFRNDAMYTYGAARMKVIQDIGGQPKTIAELDVPSTADKPQVYTIPLAFGTQKAGVTIEYAYTIPKVLENFWMQNMDDFPRPELLLDWMELEGPIHDTWPTASQSRLMPVRIDASNENQEVAAAIIRFARNAFRRPVSTKDVAPYVRLYFDQRKQGQSPIDAYQSALVNILISPHFLYLVEKGGTNDEGPYRKITEHELATRLSYFLWSSQPDSELARYADQKTLSEPNVLMEQVRRMLEDKKSESLVKNFTDQWLGLRQVGTNPPANDLYPHYDRHLEASMIEEARATFRTILREKRNAMDFVDASYVVINERLARFYGIGNVRGDEFRVVELEPGHPRGGVLTQASMLSITSNGTRTSPVKRGTWVLKNILGQDPGLPVANAGDIAPKVPGIDKATVRKRLEIHRELPQCARCHSKIDPLGLALENFDASGYYREQEGFGYKGRIQKEDPPIDAKAKLPNGTAINGASELKKALRAEEDSFLRCLTGKLMTYALGRELTLADQPTVNEISDKVKTQNHRLDALILLIVQSESFQRY
jgi:mono/diheme cytochrome c family protein